MSNRVVRSRDQSNDDRSGNRSAERVSRATRLFGALEQLFPVSFRVHAGSLESPAVIFGGTKTDARRSLRYSGSRHKIGRRTIRFGSGVDRRLSGRILLEHRTPVGEVATDSGLHVLASADGLPVWVRSARHGQTHDEVSVDLLELGPEEALRDRLMAGSFMGLLPLIEFLRDITRDRAWTPPRLRAAIVVDDPNLHWPSYGVLDYRKVVAHAIEHEYHAVMATVPLDSWFVHPAAGRVFRENRSHLSLAVHGNNHRRDELARLRSPLEADRLLSQAVRRIEHLERRSRLRVARVMIPPHEAFGKTAAAALARSSFEGICLTRAYPWAGDPTRPFAAPATLVDLSGWRSADLVDSGFPAVLRRGLFEYDELVIRSYLDLPLVVYGHVSDLADGLAPFADVARVVNAQGDVSWLPLGEIFATNVEQRVVGDRAEVRPLGRRVKLDLPPAVEEIVIVYGEGQAPGELEIHSAEAKLEPDEGGRYRITRTREAETLRIELRLSAATIRTGGHRQKASLGAIGRRVLAESRDRLRLGS